MRDFTPKLWLLACALFFTGFSGARLLAQDEGAAADPLKLDYVLIYPDEKAPELVKVEEDNPFVALADLNSKQDVGNSEENLVKDRLLSMKVVGSSKRPQGGYRVQLGDIKLEEGKVVPDFLPDQSVRLRVNSITDSEIEFVWMEKQRSGLPPRTLLMPIRMRPVVRQMLPGQRGIENATPTFGLNEGTLLKAAGADSSPPKRGEVVGEEPPKEGAETDAETAGSQPAEAPRKKSAADAVLDMFFNQGGSLPSPK